MTDTVTPPRDPSTEPLSTAITCIRTRLTEQLSLATIASAAGVAPRELQEQFLARYGVAPMRYVRQVRLDRVHTQLRRTPATTPLIDIVRQCGFGHLGRFTTAYTERFGEHPDTTLRASTPLPPASTTLG